MISNGLPKLMVPWQAHSSLISVFGLYNVLVYNLIEPSHTVWGLFVVLNLILNKSLSPRFSKVLPLVLRQGY